MFALFPFLISLFTFPTLITNIFGFRLIGLTGGISTGKSTVTRTLKNLGIPVIDFDLIAREVVAPNSSCLNAIKAEFGDDIVNASDGTLNRTKLGEVIFNNAEKRKKLGAIMQRPIMLRFLWLLIQFFFLGLIPSKYYTSGSTTNQDTIDGPLAPSHGINTKELYPGLKQPFNGSKVVVLDCPLLFESGIVNLCSSTLFINCDQEVQTTRLMERDSITREQAETKIRAQWNNDMKIRLAHNVINNNGTVEELYSKLVAWWRHVVSTDFGIMLMAPHESFNKRMSGLLNEQKRVQGLFDSYIKDLEVWKKAKTGTQTPQQQQQEQQDEQPSPQPPSYTKSLVYPMNITEVLNKSSTPSTWAVHHPSTWCFKPTMLSVLFIGVLALPSYFFIQWFEKSWFTPSTATRLAAKSGGSGGK